MKIRVILSIWIFVASLAALLSSAFVISKTLGAFSVAQISSYGPRVPAASAGIAAQAGSYPLWLLVAAGASTAIAVYFWRSARPVETKTIAVTLVAAINMFLAANLPLVVLVAYFMLPKLENGP
jgi:hypothetical protein